MLVSLLVLSLILKLVPNFVPLKTNAIRSCSGNITLKASLSVICYKCIIHQINIVCKSKLKAITKRHLRKLDKFCSRTSTPTNEKVTSSHIRNTVHNFSNYPLSNEEYKTL